MYSKKKKLTLENQIKIRSFNKALKDHRRISSKRHHTKRRRRRLFFFACLSSPKGEWSKTKTSLRNFFKREIKTGNKIYLEKTIVKKISPKYIFIKINRNTTSNSLKKNISTLIYIYTHKNYLTQRGIMIKYSSNKANWYDIEYLEKKIKTHSTIQRQKKP